ncbi:WD repeat protein [Aspergillus udagawae]|uniref:WD repeat protein n=1 Tax=Aspergillus udagawae TaxID=91492 RepID=A0A8H3RG69_9EURO|nr:WD repeat protein [Aspergillus udagawae]
MAHVKVAESVYIICSQLFLHTEQAEKPNNVATAENIAVRLTSSFASPPDETRRIAMSRTYCR